MCCGWRKTMPVSSSVLDLASRPDLCGTDTVAKLSPFTHATRRLSYGRVDGAAVAWRRVDAIDANLKFRNFRNRR